MRLVTQNSNFLLLLVLSLTAGYFGHIFYSDLFEDITAKSDLDFRPEILQTLHEAQKDAESLDFKAPAVPDQKDCAPQPTKRNLKKGLSPQIESRFFSRRERLLAQCKLQKDEQFTSHVNTCKKNEFWPSGARLTHMMLNPRNKLAGCLVEKSGSSSWHKVFWTLRQPNDEFIPSKAYSLNYAAMGKVRPETWSKAMNDPEWIRFVTARHPLARLYSGWNRNLRREGPMTKSLVQQMRLKYFIKEKDPEHAISWMDFIKFFSIAVRRYPKLINTHFIPIYMKCGLCMRQFDYIIKAETSDEDGPIILSQIDYKEKELERRNQADQSWANDPAEVGQFYKNVDPTLLEPILQYYEKDMAYLGYGLDRSTWKLTF